VDVALATALLEAQCPELLAGPLCLVDEGWDNVTYRVGPDHALRLPRRRVAVDLLLNEQRWLPTLAEWLELPVPRPVFAGRPSDLFAWPWSIVEWVHGATADAVPLDARAALTLANALSSLHRPAPPDAPANLFRGVPLAERRGVVTPRLRRLGIPRLDELWARALEAGPFVDRVWLHGDLHPRNVVVVDGRLGGIIDWGDLCGGDRATDLACAWTLFDAPERRAFLEAYEHTPDDRARAAGWAVNFGSALLESGEARHVPLGEAIVRRLIEE